MEKLVSKVTLEELNILIANCASMYEKTKNRYYKIKWEEYLKEFNEKKKETDKNKN